MMRARGSFTAQNCPLPADIFGDFCCNDYLSICRHRRPGFCNSAPVYGNFALGNPGLDDVPAVLRVLLQACFIKPPLLGLCITDAPHSMLHFPLLISSNTTATSSS